MSETPEDIRQIASNLVTELCVGRGQCIGFRQQENEWLERKIATAILAERNSHASLVEENRRLREENVALSDGWMKAKGELAAADASISDLANALFKCRTAICGYTLHGGYDQAEEVVAAFHEELMRIDGVASAALAKEAQPMARKEACSGTSIEPDECPECSGSGIEMIAAGHGNIIEEPCSYCDGTGNRRRS